MFLNTTPKLQLPAHCTSSKLKFTMTRLGLGTILGPLRHLPIEIIARIKEEANLTKRLEKINRWVNVWIEDLTVGPWVLDNDWTELFAEAVLTIRRQENSIRRLRE